MANKTVLGTLKAARKLITPEECRTTKVYARGKSGRAVQNDSPRAVSFCASGALWRVNHGGDEMHEAHRVLGGFMGGNIAIFNDTHTHAEVLAAFDAAIAKEKEAQHGR